MSDNDVKTGSSVSWIFIITGFVLLSVGFYFLMGTYSTGASLISVMKENWPHVTLFALGGFMFAAAMKFPTSIELDDTSEERIQQFYKSMKFLSSYKFPDNYTETIKQLERIINEKNTQHDKLIENIRENEALISTLKEERDQYKRDLQTEKTANPPYTGENICEKMKEILRISAQYHNEEFKKDQSNSLHLNQKRKIDTLNLFVMGKLEKRKDRTPDYRVQQDMAIEIWQMCANTRDKEITWKTHNDDSCSSETQPSRQKDAENVDISTDFRGR